MTFNRNRKSLLAAAALTAVAGLTLAAAPSHAQSAYDRGYGNEQAYDDRSDMSGVTVTAPRRHVGRDPATGADIEQVSASRIVDFADLDLSTRHGARVLHARIERAARSACKELDTRFPDATDDFLGRTCVSDAVQNAMDQVSPDIYAYNSDWRR